MRTTPKLASALVFLVGAGLTSCELKEAEVATTTTPKAPEAVTTPESPEADGWFVSEHGFRIPAGRKSAFLACVEERGATRRDGSGCVATTLGVAKPRTMRIVFPAKDCGFAAARLGGHYAIARTPPPTVPLYIMFGLEPPRQRDGGE